MSRQTTHIHVVRTDATDAEAVDTADLNQLYRRFAPYVARVGARLLGRGQDLEDLVQDVFLDAHRGLTKLRDADAVRGWLATITVRKARRRLRRRMIMRWLMLDTPLEPAKIVDTGASAESRVFNVAAQRVLDTMNPDARIAWIMHHVEGKPLEDVALYLNCSRATAHRRVAEAQRLLKEGLAHVTT